MFLDLNFNAGSWYINPCIQLASFQLKAQMSSIPDELTTTVFSIVGSLPTLQKAKLILDHCLALIEAGEYGHMRAVEHYLEVYLKTPDLPTDDISRALFARGRARTSAGHQLILLASRDFEAASISDPSCHEFQMRRPLRLEPAAIHFAGGPALQRVPLEIWDRIASFIPRYFLRNWLSLRSFHREIALRRVFHTVDLYLDEDSNWNRTLDIFDRVRIDPSFSRIIKSLRIHWAYVSGDMLKIMSRLFRTALPEFRALEELEWIGYPELRADMVKALLKSHPNLVKLGLIGFHFDAVGVSGFTSLKRFTLRAEDDDHGDANMNEVRTVLDKNENTLTHLTLGANLARTHSWDLAFGSPTIQNLTHLELVDTRISHVVLARIAHAYNLVSLTLHGTLDTPAEATAIFGANHIPSYPDAGCEGTSASVTGALTHVLLPRLEAFRFALVGHDDDDPLFGAVVQFLRARPHLRRLDLGMCPWELVRGLIPELTGLRALRVRIASLTSIAVDALVRGLPSDMQAIHLSCVESDRFMHEYAHAFSRFGTLNMLHLYDASSRRTQPSHMHESQVHACDVALTIPSLDYVGWHGEHFVVVRHHHLGSSTVCGQLGGGVAGGACAELRELPVRRRLDCGNGVDLGSDDAMWIERKDVPIDYEVSGLES
ncbi:hypothetical protein EDB92DRAFT_1855074 [Lactarius akahatsu]|uniref:Uncharacterized protein n=1 Tax=Lactarius akahatsu TaxID=416441 RepID=A0AAD4Q8U8_9AGAM|nr:hypothetical protein EDB92DRAFT_1855074 [Lactarius akahatsu]